MQTLTGVDGGTLLRPFLIPSIGTPSVTWGALRSNTIVQQTYASGGWQTGLSLSGLPNEAISAATSVVSRGGVKAAAWVKYDSVANIYETWVQITDAGNSVATSRVSNGYVETSASAHLVATADGGITVIWGELDSPNTVGGPLLSRHWTPVSGWSAAAEIEPSPSIVTVRGIQQMPDGRALLFYEMRESLPATPRDAQHLWARIIDASGVAGAATRLDDISQGFSASWGIHFALRGNDIVTAWLQEPASDGAYCVVSRVFKNNAWSSPTCVNASPLASKTWFQPRLQVSASGQVWLAWFGDTVYVSTLGANDTWSMPESVGAPKAGESSYSLFGAATCQDGSTAVAWQIATSAGVGLAMRVRDASGVWGQRMDLAVPVTGTLDVVKVSTDASCNWTAVWSIHDSTDRISARRVLTSGGLQAPVVLAENITLPTTVLSGYRYFLGTVALTVEATGPAVVVWNEATAHAIKSRRLE